MTQCDKVLAMLRAAGRSGITALEMVNHAGVINGSGRISDLRNRGHVIECYREHGLDRYRIVSTPLPTKDVVTSQTDSTLHNDDLIPRPTGYGVP